MKLSLLQKINNNYVWLQDCICNDLKEARIIAKQTEEANSHKIEVVIAKDTTNKGIGAIIHNPVILDLYNYAFKKLGSKIHDTK